MGTTNDLETKYQAKNEVTPIKDSLCLALSISITTVSIYLPDSCHSMDGINVAILAMC